MVGLIANPAAATPAPTIIMRSTRTHEGLGTRSVGKRRNRKAVLSVSGTTKAQACTHSAAEAPGGSGSRTSAATAYSPSTNTRAPISAAASNIQLISSRGLRTASTVPVAPRTSASAPP